MNTKLSLLILAGAAGLSACGGGSSSSSASNPSPAAETLLEGIPANVSFEPIATPITSSPVTTYGFASSLDATREPIYHNGQTLRQLLMLDMISMIKNDYTAKDAAATVTADMEFFLDDNGGTSIAASPIVFRPNETGGATNNNIAVRDNLLNAGALNNAAVANYGDVGSAMLRDKISGEDREAHLLGGRLLGWSEGLDADPRPSELVDYLVTLLNAEVTTNPQATVPTIGGDVDVDVAYVDGNGRDFAQLLQTFLWGAITFNQATADYFGGDFASLNTARGTNGDTEGEHDWDEAWGYFGAAANYPAYSDAEISAQESRNGVDTDAASVNLSSEYNFSASVDCAERDLDSATGTDFTKQVYDAFATGREVLNSAAANQPTNLTSQQANTVTQAIQQASQVWEQCIAATTIHYINETNDSLQAFIDGQGTFANIAAYRDLAENWSGMKGFALYLQFSPNSPFRQDADTLTVYEVLLAAMGDQAQFGSVAEAQTYLDTLTEVRGWFGTVYGFADADVAAW